MIKNVLKQMYKTYSYNKKHKLYLSRIKKNIKNANCYVPEITSSEKREIINFWNQYGIKPEFDYYRWFYHVTGIHDCRFISEDIYDKYILPKFVENNVATVLSDKNLFDLFFPEYRFPETVFHNISGVLLNDKYCLLKREDAVNLAKQYSHVVVKPSIASGKGKGVCCLPGDAINDVFIDNHVDYIVQELVHQHPVFSAFNETSVNVVRITTLLLKNQIVILSPAFRVGDPGDFTDQGNSEKAINITIGIDNKGCLKSVGIANNGAHYNKLPWGPEFAGIKIPCFDEMIEITKRAHMKLAKAKLIGWDLTVDEDSNVILIECNLKWPGIMKYQYCNGPFFGECTNDVLDYVFSNRILV